MSIRFPLPIDGGAPHPSLPLDGEGEGGGGGETDVCFLFAEKINSSL